MASCPVSVILVCACAALAGEFAAGRQIEVTPDDERAPLHDILFRHHSAPAPRFHVPNESVGVDDLCFHNSECESGLCCRVDGVYATACMPMSKIGESCEPENPKSAHYKDYCPCLEGYCVEMDIFSIMPGLRCVQRSQTQGPVTSGTRQRPQSSVP
ncbi:uncharacterized protein [Dermacentor andersoni]|uniref:uncharacterized protein n=1 Tax=Dermacentor andersoni TaxID=34620 RepID=UPI0024170B88|nr:uncharacterized protein LOC129383814 [Dermacentor andersoni]